ncbi:CPBP family intramembrane glutamic endopeptidase [Aestuariimicrobium ganziense]|uniref:CPBP family intramembrane glutamic endopeptidase n=1 Tax=Aestuariimicrobium ganziense TaxID=2773677 RepID=UPI001940F218|nr:CPBP family intramembrane glutamic endopeptidase [Aestuariimicrobium ganziense]
MTTLVETHRWGLSPARRWRQTLGLFALATVVAAALLVPFALGWWLPDALNAVVPVGQFVPLVVSLLLWRRWRATPRLRDLWALPVPSVRRLLGGLALVTVAVSSIAAAQTLIAWAIGLPIEVESTLWTTLPTAFVLALAMAIPCFGEEVAWRGHLVHLLDRWPGWPRVLVVSTLWALWHLPLMATYLHLHLLDTPQAIASTVNVFAAGLVLGWVRERTDSVWPAVWGHALLNTLLVLVNSSTVSEDALSPDQFWALHAIGWACWFVAAGVLARRRQ